MRVGLIADIHGNLVALDTVLDELRRAQVEQIVCLGDVAALGPQPRDCLARLRELGHACVMGNTDEWLLLDSVTSVPASPPVAELTRWRAARLTPADREFVASFALTIEIPLGPRRALLAFHGSPASPEDVIAAGTSESELDELLSGRSGWIMAGGHTHVQLVRRHGDGYLVNPGSVGLPAIGPGTPGLAVNTNVAWAEYALLAARC